MLITLLVLVSEMMKESKLKLRYDLLVYLLFGFSAVSQETQGQQRPTLMKRLTRSDKRYHTAGAVDDLKVRNTEFINFQ